MKVMLQTSLDGCPEFCPNFDYEYQVDPYMETLDGTAAGVMVIVDCAHCEVCRIREKSPDGEIREIG